MGVINTGWGIKGAGAMEEGAWSGKQSPHRFGSRFWEGGLPHPADAPVTPVLFSAAAQRKAVLRMRKARATKSHRPRGFSNSAEK